MAYGYTGPSGTPGPSVFSVIDRIRQQRQKAAYEAQVKRQTQSKAITTVMKFDSHLRGWQMAKIVKPDMSFGQYMMNPTMAGAYQKKAAQMIMEGKAEMPKMMSMKRYKDLFSKPKDMKAEITGDVKVDDKPMEYADIPDELVMPQDPLVNRGGLLTGDFVAPFGTPRTSLEQGGTWMTRGINKLRMEQDQKLKTGETVAEEEGVSDVDFFKPQEDAEELALQQQFQDELAEFRKENPLFDELGMTTEELKDMPLHATDSTGRDLGTWTGSPEEMIERAKQMGKDMDSDTLQDVLSQPMKLSDSEGNIVGEVSPEKTPGISGWLQRTVPGGESGYTQPTLTQTGDEIAAGQKHSKLMEQINTALEEPDIVTDEQGNVITEMPSGSIQSELKGEIKSADEYREKVQGYVDEEKQAGLQKEIEKTLKQPDVITDTEGKVIGEVPAGVIDPELKPGGDIKDAEDFRAKAKEYTDVDTPAKVEDPNALFRSALDDEGYKNMVDMPDEAKPDFWKKVDAQYKAAGQKNPFPETMGYNPKAIDQFLDPKKADLSVKKEGLKGFLQRTVPGGDTGYYSQKELKKMNIQKTKELEQQIKLEKDVPGGIKSTEEAYQESLNKNIDTPTPGTGETDLQLQKKAHLYDTQLESPETMPDTIEEIQEAEAARKLGTSAASGYGVSDVAEDVTDVTEDVVAPLQDKGLGDVLGKAGEVAGAVGSIKTLYEADPADIELKDVKAGMDLAKLGAKGAAQMGSKGGAALGQTLGKAAPWVSVAMSVNTIADKNSTDMQKTGAIMSAAGAIAMTNFWNPAGWVAGALTVGGTLAQLFGGKSKSKRRTRAATGYRGGSGYSYV
tara:strand:+ start:5733 stop:8267 length:2535 start_codon:yes stop_codon:yes gene_type:complete